MQSGTKMAIGLVILASLLAVLVIYLTVENAEDLKAEQDRATLTPQLIETEESE